MNALWASVFDRASQQHGLLTRRDLTDEGVPASTITRWMGHHLIPVHHRVYRVVGAPRTWEQAVLAAVLAAGAEAAASHLTAAHLAGLLRDRPDRIEVAVPRGRHPSVEGVVVHRLRDFDAASVIRVNGIPTVAPLRTLVHLGATAPRFLVEVALERGLTDDVFSYAAVEWFRHDLGRQGRNGVGVLGEVLDQRALGAKRPDSILEPRFATLCRDHNIEMPIFQLEVVIGGRCYRIDFAYPDIKLAIEVDGFDPHGRRQVWYEGHDREGDLVDDGWTVLHVTWQMIVTQPEKVAQRIRRQLARLRSAS
jgi:very-short-patch-repair endonuclease